MRKKGETPHPCFPGVYGLRVWPLFCLFANAGSDTQCLTCVPDCAESKPLMPKSLPACFAFLLLPAVLLCAQTAKVSGSITDTTGRPISGAVIRLNNFARNTISDGLGSFQLSVPANRNNLLSVKHLGFKGQEMFLLMKPGENRQVNFRLAAETRQLSEV